MFSKMGSVIEMVMEYQIRDKDGLVIGRFSEKPDKDEALKKHVDFGIACEEEIG